MAFNPNQPRDPHGRFGEIANAFLRLGDATGVAATLAQGLAQHLSKAPFNYHRISTKTLDAGHEALHRAGLGINKLTTNDWYNLATFVTDESEDINDSLRHFAIGGFGKPGDKYYTDPNAYSHIKELDATIAKSRLPFNLQLFRGIRGDIVDKLNPSTIFRDAGYQSTSVSKRVARAFAGPVGGVVTLLAPKGHAAIAHNPEEYEVLLPRDSTYRVLHRNDKDIFAELLK